MYPPIVHPQSSALFLDFDGTLVSIAATPDAVEVTAELRALLQSLSSAASGALALVTGRSLDSLDELLQWPVEAAGSHGAERRNAGTAPLGPAETEALHQAEEAMAALAGEHGLLVENKSHSHALHFRGYEHLEGMIDGYLEKHLDAHPELRVVRGKCVREVQLTGLHKGRAIASFMETEPFAGRRPVYVGDDVTDEDGFAWINDVGGISVKVGRGKTRARYRLEDHHAVLHWLQAILKQGELPCRNAT